jgi:hypothetical protein
MPVAVLLLIVMPNATAAVEEGMLIVHIVIKSGGERGY